MNILPYIAQATPYTTTYQTSGAVEGAAAAAFAVMMLFAVFIGYAITAIFLMLIFKKAGVPGWAAWVPFYNNWKLLEIGGESIYIQFDIYKGVAPVAILRTKQEPRPVFMTQLWNL